MADAVSGPAGSTGPGGTDAAGGRARERRYVPDERAKVLFFGLLVFWVAFPLVLTGRFAQDAVPYLVAGDLLTEQPEAVYAAVDGDLFTLEAPFAERSCAITPADVACSEFNVAFVSTPPTLLLAAGLAAAGPTVGVLLLRAAGVLCLAGGMVALWRRLAHRTPRAGPYLAVTALALTPFVMVPTALGQTSPVLFASAAVGVAATRGNRPRSAGVAALWVAAVVLKLFPAALGVALLLRRRWSLLGWSALWVGVLGVATVLVVPGAAIDEFLSTSGQITARADGNPYNGSVDALLHAVDPGLTSGAAGAVALVLRVAAAVGAWVFVVRRRDDEDTAWAYGYLVLLLVVPLVWWHYVWLAVAAVGVALAARPRLGRELIALPVLAVASVPMSLANGFGTSWSVVQALFLLAVVALVPVLVALPEQPRDLTRRQASQPH